MPGLPSSKTEFEKEVSVRKLKSIALLTFVCLSLAATSLFASGDMTCVAGMAFRGRDGQLLDCFENAGSDCQRCSRRYAKACRARTSSLMRREAGDH